MILGIFFKVESESPCFRQEPTVHVEMSMIHVDLFWPFFTTGFRWIFEVLLKGSCMGYLLVSVLQTIARGWQTRATVPPPFNGSINVES